MRQAEIVFLAILCVLPVAALDIGVMQRLRSSDGSSDVLVIGDRDGGSTIHPQLGARGIVLRAAGGGKCGEAELGLTGKGFEARLDASARQCVMEAVNDELSPVLQIPSVLVDEAPAPGSVALQIPTKPTLQEAPKLTDFENLRLGFRVVYLPPEIVREEFTDPTTWCVTQGESCVTELINLRARVKESSKPEDKECKSAKLHFSVSQVKLEQGSLVLHFCRATYQPSASPISVQWMPDQVSGQGAHGGMQRSVQVAAVRVAGAMESLSRGDRPVTKFTANAPATPAQNTFYAEFMFQNRRDMALPTIDPASYSAVTNVTPVLRSRSVYGFKFNLTPDNIPDLVPLAINRKWSIHAAPVISMVLNSEEESSNPNRISIGATLDARRWFAEKSCHFEFQSPHIVPASNCGTPPAVRRLSLQAGPSIELTKDATSKNFIVDPHASLFFRPLRTRTGLTVNFVPSVGLETGTVLASPLDAKARAQVGPINRFLGQGLVGIGFQSQSKSAWANFMNRLDLSLEYSFRQLFQPETVSVNPGSTVYPPGQLSVGENLPVAFPGSTKGIASVLETRSGTRKYSNLQATFDLKNGVILVVSHRHGQLPPLYGSVDQFSLGIGFRINSKSKPSFK